MAILHVSYPNIKEYYFICATNQQMHIDKVSILYINIY